MIQLIVLWYNTSIRQQFFYCCQPRLKCLNNSSVRALTRRWMVDFRRADGARVGHPSVGEILRVVRLPSLQRERFRISFRLPCCQVISCVFTPFSRLVLSRLYFLFRSRTYSTPQCPKEVSFFNSLIITLVYFSTIKSIKTFEFVRPMAEHVDALPFILSFSVALHTRVCPPSRPYSWLCM